MVGVEYISSLSLSSITHVKLSKVFKVVQVQNFMKTVMDCNVCFSLPKVDLILLKENATVATSKFSVLCKMVKSGVLYKAQNFCSVLTTEYF